MYPDKKKILKWILNILMATATAGAAVVPWLYTESCHNPNINDDEKVDPIEIEIIGDDILFGTEGVAGSNSSYQAVELGTTTQVPVIWSLEETILGISINSSSGVLSWNDSLDIGSYPLTIIAISKSDSAVIASLSITLIIEEVVEEITITIDGPDSVNIDFGENGNLQYYATVTGTQEDSVTWTIVGNPSGVSIDSDGLFSYDDSLSSGNHTFTIKATLDADTNISQTKDVTIYVDNEPENITVTIYGNDEIYGDFEDVGEYQYNVIVTGTQDDSVTWSLEDEITGKIFIDEDGLVTWYAALDEGEYTFTVVATSDKNSSVRDQKTVTLHIVNESDELSVSLSYDNLILTHKVNEDVITIYANVTGAGHEDEVRWNYPSQLPSYVSVTDVSTDPSDAFIEFSYVNVTTNRDRIIGNEFDVSASILSKDSEEVTAQLRTLAVSMQYLDVNNTTHELLGFKDGITDDISDFEYLSIPRNIETVVEEAFNGKLNGTTCNVDTITFVENNNSLSEFGKQSFINCTSLNNFHFPIIWSSLIDIQESAFENCGFQKLDLSRFPANSSLGTWAFKNNSQLSEIIFGLNLKYGNTNEVSAEIFYGCSYEVFLTILYGNGGNIPNFDGGPSATENTRGFSYQLFGTHKTRLTNVVIDNTITYSGNYSFYNCVNLRTVNRGYDNINSGTKWVTGTHYSIYELYIGHDNMLATPLQLSTITNENIGTITNLFNDYEVTYVVQHQTTEPTNARLAFPVEDISRSNMQYSIEDFKKNGSSDAIPDWLTLVPVGNMSVKLVISEEIDIRDDGAYAFNLFFFEARTQIYASVKITFTIAI